ncbi:MAG: acyl-CoA thioesterase [Acidobacteria bacterium]|nr:MAG: acyl-CoA thioesterase [Acidobacteriota bacterium]
MHLRFTRDELLRARAAIRHPWPVRLQDVDAGGVVFFPRYLEAFNDAMAALLERCGHPLPDLVKSGLLLPVVRAEAQYLAPLRFGERAAVAVVGVHCGRAGRLALGYRVERADGAPAAVGQTDHRAVSAAGFERTELPGPLREALLRAVGGG